MVSACCAGQCSCPGGTGLPEARPDQCDAFSPEGCRCPAPGYIYQLARQQGLAWSPCLDAQIGRRGGELLAHATIILADIDSPAAARGGR
jgi:hypothetical protein